MSVFFRKNLSILLIFLLIFGSIPFYGIINAGATVGTSNSQDEQSIISASEYIRSEMKKRNSSVEGTVTFINASADAVMEEIISKVFEYTSDAEEGDYLKSNCSSYSWSYSVSFASAKKILNYKFSFKYLTTYEQEQTVSENVTKILSELSLTGLSEYEKAKKIYDYIVSNVSYDYQHYLDPSYINQFTAYAALVDKKAVCEGYSLLFYRMALEAGLSCRIVSGKVDNNPHAWNLIKIGDLYYSTDSTFASTGNSRDNYFLKGSLTFKDHLLDEEFTTDEFKNEVSISEFDYVDNHNLITVGSGSLNSTSNWRVDETTENDSVKRYTLVISGNGATPNYSTGDSLPWDSWKNKITSVIVESPIISVGNFLFSNMSSLESIQVSSSVLSLGDYAFYNCPNLSNIQITSNTQSFGKCSIGGEYGDTIWEYIPIQNKLIISGNGKMGEPYKDESSSEMTSEKVPWNRLAQTITEVEIKNGVQNISSFAFSGFSSLSTISLPGSLTTIEMSAFENCSSITYICLPQSVSEIGHYAFRYCEGLRNFYIPSSVKRIGVNAFYNCPYLHEFYFYGDAPTFENNAIYNSDVITVFYSSDSTEWSRIKSKYTNVKFEIWNPTSYDNSGTNENSDGIKYATNGKYGDDIYWSFDETSGILNISGSGAMQEPVTISDDGGYEIVYHTGAVAWNPFLHKIKTVNVSNGITELTRYAFFGMQNAKTINLPDSITSIGKSAFEKCYCLTQLNLSENLNVIGGEAFLDCNGLQSLYVSDSLKSIGDDAFKNTGSLKDIYYGGSKSQWNSIIKGNNDNYLGNVEIHYNCNKPLPDTSNYTFSFSGKQYYVLGKEDTLVLSYQSSVDGQVMSELKNIVWTNSNPDVATVSNLDNAIADVDNNNVTVMATVNALSVGSTTIEGTSVDGRKASFTINVVEKTEDEYDISKLDQEITDFNQFCALHYSRNASIITDKYMTYKEIEDNYNPTAYAVNNILSFAWKSNFSFTDSSQVWETVLLDILFKNGAQLTTITAWEKESLKTSKSMCKFLQENTIKDIDASINFDIESNLEAFAEKYDASKGFTDSTSTKDVVKILIDTAKSVKEFVDYYSQYVTLRQMIDSDIKGFLYKLRNTENYIAIPAFSRAVDRIIEYIEVKPEKLAEAIIAENTAGEILSKSINVTLGLTVKALLGEKVFALIDITKSTTIHLLNTILGVGDTANFNVYLYILDKVDDAASEAFTNAADECIESNGKKNTRVIIGGLQFFSCLYSCGISTCKSWADVITTNILTRIESDAYLNVIRPHYDLTTDYLNLNHKSSSSEKKKLILDKCEDDAEYNDLVLGNLPYQATVLWYEQSGQSESDNVYIVICNVENPNGTNSYYAQIAIKNTLFKPPTVASKAGYESPTEWYTDSNCTNKINSNFMITENTVLYSKYKATIWHVMTNDNSGVKILNMNGNINLMNDNISLHNSVLPVGDPFSLDNTLETTESKVDIPAFIGGYEVLELGDNIFLDCGNITDIFIPNTVVTISDSAFNGISRDTKFTVVAGSKAENFLKEKGYSNIETVEDYGATDSDDNITWSFCNGTLTISGNGRMDNYTTVNNYYTGIDTDVPWKDYLSSINTVKFEGNITYIGDCAFSDCTALSNIEFPATLEEIGSKVFTRCTSLKSVIIPDNVENIGEWTFGGCEKLTNVDLPKNLKSISSSLFSACKNLSTIYIPESVERIGSSAFNVCYNLTNIDLPKNIKHIGGAAFFQCKSLKSIVIPDGVEKIDGQTFQQCYNLSMVILPKSLKEIGGNAFRECVSLKNIDIPYNVTSINTKAFYGCVGLLSVTINNPFLNLIDSDIFTDVNNDIVFYCYDNSTTKLYCEDKNLSYKLMSGYKLNVSTQGNRYTYDGSVKDDDFVFDTSEDFSGLRITYDITEELYYDGGCQSICTLGRMVRRSVNPNFLIDAGTYTIHYFFCAEGSEVFCGKANIIIEKADPTLYFEKDVVSVGVKETSVSNKLISNVSSLVTYSSSNTSVATVGNDGKVNIENTGECIITADFEGSTNYNSKSAFYKLIIKNYEYTIIGDNAVITGYFGNDPKLIIPDEIGGYTVTGIGDNAFEGCSELTEIIIPDTVTSIGDFAFKDCVGITHLTLPNTLTYLGNSAFEYCRNLSNITIPDSISEIRENTFKSCYKLENIDFGTGVTKIGVGAFDECIGLTNVEIGSNVSNIGTAAFAYCINLAYVTIPKSVTMIDEHAFDGGLDSVEQVVNYLGSESEWNKISIGYRAFRWNSTVYYNETDTTTQSTETTKATESDTSECETTQPIPVQTTTVSLSKSSAILYTTEKITIKVTVKDGKGSTTFKSNNTKVATVTDTGVVTAVMQGTAQITVANNGVKKVFTVTVKKPILNKKTAVTLKSSKTVLYRTGKTTIRATVKNGKGKTTYISNNKQVATVNTSGVVKAVRIGKATITVTNNGVKKTFTVIVKNPYLNTKSRTLKVNKTFTLKITGRVGKATFKSSNKKVATVNSQGKVVSKKKGAAIITVTTNGINLKCKVNVK
ncbi:MAG: leucine-rich repeat protein [Oscillospiraceae bacterium]|nr:leucine-rich repeat protein [Oscillospiraceae bacterium]